MRSEESIRSRKELAEDRILKLSRLLYKYKDEEANTIDAILIWFKEEIICKSGLTADDRDSMIEEIEYLRK